MCLAGARQEGWKEMPIVWKAGEGLREFAMVSLAALPIYPSSAAEDSK